MALSLVVALWVQILGDEIRAVADEVGDGRVHVVVTAAVHLLVGDDAATGVHVALVRADASVHHDARVGHRPTGVDRHLDPAVRILVDQITSGSSYLAQHDMRVHFGLGAATKADRLEITWPDGKADVMENLPVNHVITIREGQGETRRVPFAR